MEGRASRPSSRGGRPALHQQAFGANRGVMYNRRLNSAPVRATIEAGLTSYLLPARNLMRIRSFIVSYALVLAILLFADRPPGSGPRDIYSHGVNLTDAANAPRPLA